MNTQIFLIIAFVTNFIISLVVINQFLKDSKHIQMRLAALGKRINRKEIVDGDLEKPFVERAILPIVKQLSKSFSKFMPEGRVNQLDKKLLFAGNPGNLAPYEFLGIQYTLAFGLPSLALVVLISSGKTPIELLITASLIGAVGYYLPDLYLKTLSSKRKEEIEKTLPDALDLLTVSVEAGLGFDSALAKVSAKTKGSLAHEFTRVLQEIKMGKPRRDALKDLTTRCESDNLANFISSLIQADQLGVSIGNVLRLQSEQMRMVKRQKTEEKAMKAPVKMLIPLVLFVFPTLFIVLLGPALIQIFDTLF